MKLKELLDRAYRVLGDDPVSPRWFDRTKLRDIVNRGTLLFRAAARDIWYRVDISTGQAQPVPGIFTIPAEILEVIRLAFDDVRLDGASVGELQSLDYKWQDRDGEPERWSGHGLQHNQFRLWPRPPLSVSREFTWTSDTGVTVRFVDSAGANYTFTADPAVPGWSAENGILLSLDSVSITETNGELFHVTTSQADQITLWGVQKPPVLVDEASEVPLRRPWQIAILWYVLWQSYEQEGVFHNRELAAYYRDQFWEVVERCKARVANPIPSQVRSLRGAPEFLQEGAGAFSIRFQDVIVNSVRLPTDWS